MSDSPYNPQVPPRILRSYKKNPYRDIRSKWNIIRWINVFISGILMIWAISSPDGKVVILRTLVWGAHGIYYLANLYDYEKMEKTFITWNFRKDALLKRHTQVKFRMEPEQLLELCPVDEIIIVIQNVITLVRYRGNQYGVLIRGFPKKTDNETQEVLELNIKEFLDGLQENLFFKSIRYTVKGQQKDARQNIEKISTEGKHTKPRDLHLQDLLSYVDNDNRPQSLERFIYFMDLGKCRNVKHAMIQYNSIIPGLEELLKPAMKRYYFVTDPLEIEAIYYEFYHGKEAIL